MTIALTVLPYAENALEPHISAETLQTHHGKHHKTYVDKLNAAIEGTELADKSLEEIIHHAEGSGNKGMFNNAAQSWNHGFYWNSLSPDATAPAGDLAAAIDRDFGSLDELKKKLKETAINHFASGWAWLVSRDGTLSVTDTHDAGTELVAGIKPLLVVDVWEHAYYIDRKNVRPDYVNATVDNLLNWDFAAENFAREGTWTYPG
ncbi:superoxide dismutase [Sphingopyxis sp. KK2]|jgi:Fe-Mn family superoxide dismutase|uniref:superoxide dismutase n=1 Tax=Sphingopyxis sp. KK2 TaxID=1855727 RepID=UPI00097E637B|nr:superoxide dismutase [Sphingopyxis sp. KK2]